MRTRSVVVVGDVEIRPYHPGRTARGPSSSAFRAGPPSPAKPGDARAGNNMDVTVGAYHQNPVVPLIGEIDVAIGILSDAPWIPQRSAGGRSAVSSVVWSRHGLNNVGLTKGRGGAEQRRSKQTQLKRFAAQSSNKHF